MTLKSQPEQRRTFTPAQRAYLIKHYRKHSVAWLAQHMSRSYWATLDELFRLSHQGLLHIGKNRNWEEPEQEYLEARYGLITDLSISRRLHRSVGGIRQRAIKTGLNRTSNFLTAREASRILGVDSKTVAYWIKMGKLSAHKSTIVGVGLNTVWHISHEDFEAFIKERAGFYDVHRIDRITYAYWRNLAEKHAPIGVAPKVQRDWTPDEDAFILNNHRSMTQSEIGRRLRRTKEAVHYRTGILRKAGHFMSYNFPWNDAQKRICTRIPWTPEEDEFIRANWGRERSNEEIEALRAAGKRLWGTRITAAEVARALSRTQQACEARASRLEVNNPGWKAQQKQEQEGSAA